VFVYDAAGQLAAEYGSTVSVSGTEFVHGDMLGSTRLVTDGVVAGRRFDYWPFGAELTAGDTAYRTVGFAGAGPAQRFTGKERDAETGLDYFGARYMSAAQGRFTSPDVPLADQWEKDPQSWNLYSYVRNNPLRFVDPTGHECVNLDGGTQGDDGKGTPCAGAQLDTTHGVTVTGKKGNAVGAFFLNAFFALDNTANNYFAWMFKERPKLLENTPPTKEFVGQAAAATVLVGTMMIGPSGGAQAPLRLIHSEATLSKTILDGLRKKSTQEIIDTLKPGLEEGLKVKPDGRVMDGNHRIKVLMERGVDVNSLPREVLK
jgi:RHS repeat-associated protein